MKKNGNATVLITSLIALALGLGLCLSSVAEEAPFDMTASSFDSELDRSALESGFPTRGPAQQTAASVPEDLYWSNMFHALDFDDIALTKEVAGVTGLYVYNSELVIAGEFLDIEGDVSFRRIASWDGERLHDMGGGLSGGYGMAAVVMAEFDGDLIVGGYFNDAGTVVGVEHIAQWDGTNWYAMDNGFVDFTGQAYAKVRDLDIYDGQLIAAGNIKVSGGVTGGIMVWDGAHWSPLGGGTDNTVNDIWVDGDNLYAVGSFTEIGGAAIASVAYWDGATWHSMGFSGSAVYSGISFGADIYVGTGGSPYVQRWDGVGWTAFSWNRTEYPDEFLNIDGELYTLKGPYSFVYPTNGWFQKWTGTDWEMVADFTSGGYYGEGPYSIIEYEGKHLIGGYFDVIEGVATENLAWWDNSQFHSFGKGLRWSGGDPFANAFGEWDGKLMVGGYFYSAGGLDVTALAAWDGESYTALGGDMNGSVWCMTHYEGELVAGGLFTYAGGVSATRIASWDGTTWAPFGAGLGDGVRDVLEFQGDLYACGNFNVAAGDVFNYIARWDGAAWSDLDGGMDDTIYRMYVWDGKLLALGRFTWAGSIMSPHLAQWDGSAWSPLTMDIDARVYDALEWNGDLVIAGRFTSVGGIAAEGLARWDGANWYAMDYPANTAAWRMMIFDGNLYYCGFEKVDPTYPNIIGYYTGSTHHSLGSGIDPTETFILDLYNWDNQLWVGSSDMTVAGEKRVAGLTSWGPDIDGDGLPGLDDNCPFSYNPGQEDTDADDVGDVCDNCPDDLNADQADVDYDEVGDLCDNCVDVQNTDQANSDADEYGDACDNCPDISNPAQEDTDSDGVGNLCDNCPDDFNPGQEDFNQDEIGDACCCADRVGNANAVGGDEPTIGDASFMVDAKFITGTCDGILDCLTEADINQSGGTDPTCNDITLQDISTLVDYLFITGPTLGLPDCL